MSFYTVYNNGFLIFTFDNTGYVFKHPTPGFCNRFPLPLRQNVLDMRFVKMQYFRHIFIVLTSGWNKYHLRGFVFPYCLYRYNHVIPSGFSVLIPHKCFLYLIFNSSKLAIFVDISLPTFAFRLARHLIDGRWFVCSVLILEMIWYLLSFSMVNALYAAPIAKLFIFNKCS